MTNQETPEQFAVRVLAARISIKADRRLSQPSPDWIVALVEEGERRERARREAEASSSH
jgi:hypothetical protein